MAMRSVDSGPPPGNAQSIDVGVDECNFRPASMEQIKARLAMLPPIPFRDGTDETVEPEQIDAPIDVDKEDTQTMGWCHDKNLDFQRPPYQCRSY